MVEGRDGLKQSPDTKIINDRSNPIRASSKEARAAVLIVGLSSEILLGSKDLDGEIFPTTQHIPTAKD